MQRAMESGNEKVKKICEVLRKETLEPAMDEAKQIIEEARAKADQIVKESKEKAAKQLEEAEKEIEKKQTIFQASLKQGARQSIEWLKQEIEENVLDKTLSQKIPEASKAPEVLSQMIQAVIQAVQDEGVEAELSAVIPASVEPNAVNELLGQELLAKLKEKSVIVGPKKGGVELKLHKDNITIDLSDTALLELMTRYVRKDFRKYFFSSE